MKHLNDQELKLVVDTLQGMIDKMEYNNAGRKKRQYKALVTLTEAEYDTISEVLWREAKEKVA